MLANGSLDMLKGDETKYRDEVRNIFVNEIANHQHKYHTSRYLPDESFQHLKDYPLRTTQINQEFGGEIAKNQRRYQMDQAKSSGGDADRYFYDATHTSVYSGDSWRCMNDHRHALRHMHSKGHAMPNKVTTGTGKYTQATAPMAVPVEQCVGDQRYLREAVSSMGDICNGSEGGSSKSQKSSKTVVSRRSSSHELRKLVKSKCKLQEAINETVQGMCNPEDFDKTQNDVQNMIYDKSRTQLDTLPLTHCKHCTDKIHPSQSSQKDVTTEIGKTDFAESHNGNSLTLSVDDVVNSKVINPMIRKLQRMYLNNLKEEMSLMEDLERLPQKLNEVYKATIFEENDR